jgi:HD-like signal output (HDOD) protein
MTMSGKGLQVWVRKLASQSMPVAGQVIAELNALTGSEDTRLQQLSEVILRDPHLTSHVLRVANSVYFNRNHTTINTVSRAVSLIGLKGMRAISISVLLMDALLKTGPKERLLQVMAQGFHAANQAKNLVVRFDEDAAEEVFVAALLYHLGEMAFWSSEKLTDDKKQLLSKDDARRDAAAQAYLGTNFRAISLGLAKYWKLGDTLIEALKPGEDISIKAQSVILGEQLSRAAQKGWDSPEVDSVLEAISTLVGVDKSVSLHWALDAAEQAAEVALRFGAASVCPFIPSRDHQMPSRGDPMPVGRVLQADAQLQLSILRELGAAAHDAFDVNTIFQMVLEGMHRGIGLERVAIAFIQHHRVKAKFALGQGTDNWRDSFDFDASPFSDNLFTRAISQSGFSAFTREQLQPFDYGPDAEIGACLGETPCLVFVLEVNGRKPALFYADRGNFGGSLNQDHMDSFCHFATQAQINLARATAVKTPAKPVIAAK